MIHIIKIYLYGFALYFCFYVCYNMISNGIQGVTEYFVSYFQMKKIVVFLMFNSPNSSVHLWFLSALLYCYMIQYCVTKWGIKDKMLFGLSISFLVLHLILGVGLSAVGKVVPVPIVRNFLLMGYPFFCFGMMLRKKEVTILRIVTNKIAVYLLIVGLTETLISYFISGKNELYLGSIIVAFALFVIALNMRHILYSKAIIKLSQTSTIIYIIHILVGKCLSLTTLRETGWWRCASPIIVCVFSTLIALMVNELLCFEKRIQTKRCFWGK